MAAQISVVQINDGISTNQNQNETAPGRSLHLCDLLRFRNAFSGSRRTTSYHLAAAHIGTPGHLFDLALPARPIVNKHDGSCGQLSGTGFFLQDLSIAKTAYNDSRRKSHNPNTELLHRVTPPRKIALARLPARPFLWKLNMHYANMALLAASGLQFSPELLHCTHGAGGSKILNSLFPQ
jgi:hypothetical protein